jgi:hypothetical protein
MYVNNQQFEINMKDSKGNKIDRIYLNKNTCPEPKLKIDKDEICT